MRSFLTHAASALAGAAFALSLSFAWIPADGVNLKNAVLSQNLVVAMLAGAVAILAFLQRQALLARRPGAPRSTLPTPIGQ